MATPFSLSNYNRYKATINPTWPHPPEYNPTPAQTADRVARINREFAAIRDKLHADAAAEAARRAAETERLRREGGYFPGGNGYVTPRPGAWTPAMQAEVDNFSYNNPRPSPMTPNMAPLAPKQPSARERDGMPKGRGYTHEEVYGPGGQLDQRIAKEKENERKRAEMQAGLDKLKASRPKSPRAPGPSQVIQGLINFSAAQQAQMGQYATPAAPVAPVAAQSAPVRPVPGVFGDIEVVGGPGPVAMNPMRPNQSRTPVGTAPAPQAGAAPAPTQSQPPATRGGWPENPVSPAYNPAAMPPGVAYYRDPRSGVMYAVAKGSKTEQTGIGPIDGMRNAFADITGNTRPVSGTQEVSPSTQYSPKRGTLMRDNASEQMMREGGYKPIDFSVQEERSAYDALRSDYDSRRAKSKPPVKPQGQYTPPPKPASPPVVPQAAATQAPLQSVDAINRAYDAGEIDAKEWIRLRQQQEQGSQPQSTVSAQAPPPPKSTGPGIGRTLASVATGGYIPISDRQLKSRGPARVGRGRLPAGSRYNPMPMPVAQPFSPQFMPVDANVYNQMMAAGEGLSGGGASASYPQQQPPQPGPSFSGVYNPQMALPQGGVPPTPDLGPDFPEYVPVQPRQPLRRAGSTLGDVANEYLVSAPGSIATGAQVTISDIQQLLRENKISRERYRELEAAIYARQAQEQATQPR